MELKNSYIFLAREKEEQDIQKTKESLSFLELLKLVFKNVEINDTKNKSDFIITGLFKVECKNQKKDVNFKCYKVYSNYYLDIVIKEEEQEQDKINILEQVNSRLIGSGNVFDQSFVSIVSYDTVSEFYGNKLFPVLNNFERKLRKLLLNVYTFNFNLEYYTATTNKEFRDPLKERANIGKKTNTSKEEHYTRSMFYALDYHYMEILLFTPKLTTKEQKEIECFLKEEEDLTKLKDDVLREQFDKMKPRTDWERLFKNKLSEEKFKNNFKKIRECRNTTTHCKFIDKSQYDKWIKIIKDTIKSIEDAIKITEEKDFSTESLEICFKSFERLLESIKEFSENLGGLIYKDYKSIFEGVNIMTTSLELTLNQMGENIKSRIISPEVKLQKTNFSKFEDLD